MSKAKIILVIVIALVIVNLVAGIVFLSKEKEVEDDEKSNDSSSQIPQTTTQTPRTTTTTSPTSQTITPSELTRHSSRTDCWIAYQNKVYDITAFLPIHPGGVSTITPFCGTSNGFENAFTNQHGTSQVQRLAREGIYKGDLQ
jgi:cytochrome b involved in lipid metabolism